MDKINIGVTGTGSLIGQAIIKSIKKSDLSNDVRLIGCDYFKDTVGSFWCDKNYILPDVLKEENIEQWKKSIVEIIKEEKISILFIGVDFELILFSKLKSTIEKLTKCKIIVSEEETLKIGNDKYLTYEFLKENNLNHPKTWLASQVNDAKIDYPCILKPRIGARSKDVYIIENKEALLEKINFIDGAIVQELIGNNKSEYTCGVLCIDGEIIQSIALRRDLKEGNTHIAEYKKDFNQEIYDYIEKIALLLNPHGSCNFQLRLGDDNKPYLFEINPRCSGTTYIRSLFGFNEVEYIIKSLLELDPQKMELKEGKAYRYYEEKLLES